MCRGLDPVLGFFALGEMCGICPEVYLHAAETAMVPGFFVCCEISAGSYGHSSCSLVVKSETEKQLAGYCSQSAEQDEHLHLIFYHSFLQCEL